MQTQKVIIDSAAYFGTNRGIADIRVVQSATTGSGASVWAIRNKTAKTRIFISRIWMQLFQSGTGAATEMQYEWVKGTGCTAMSGGSAVTPLIKRTNQGNADIDAQVKDTGLTQTGISQGSPFFNCVWSRLTHSATQAGAVSPVFVMDFLGDPLELLQNEVLTLRQAVNSVIGDSVSGGVEFFGGPW